MEWKLCLLTHARRMILIKCTLTSIPTYLMSTTKLPKKDYDALDKIQRDFLWNFEHGKRHCYLKSWSSFQIPNKDGGLGIRNSNFENFGLLYVNLLGLFSPARTCSGFKYFTKNI